MGIHIMTPLYEKVIKPSLKVKTQSQYDSTHYFGAYGTADAGQRLFIYNASLISFGFWACRVDVAPDTIYYRIFRIDPWELLFQEVMDNNLFIPYELKLIEVEVDPPVSINFEVYLLMTHPRKYPGPRVGIGYQDEDLLPNQCFTAMSSGSLVDYPNKECAYRIKYYPE